EYRGRPDDEEAERPHHCRDLVAEELQELAPDPPGAAMERRMRPRIRGLEILARARVRQQRAGAREIVREQPIIIGEARGVPGVIAAPAAQAAGARFRLPPQARALEEARNERTLPGRAVHPQF